MKKIIKNEQGFTLIEMMIVLLVITVLLFIAIPNVAKQSKNINSKGCDAFIHMVQGQVQAYQIDNDSLPSSIDTLVTDGYLREDETTCPGGGTVTLDAEGTVSASGT
ncbi:competence type IV pilus major pilin ComGC [Domibacillus iocasae]|uniref:ComG operon protein 3 n=1 Tax=Domibacillus iocasae TaxID=1714016 RepID=A0A1E7DMR8_9BACI|nr:competence type IV pilus major pilin ComGC [Domibacillus iocasae]OES44380.1 competence protein ComG [Domibacillus iocasae]